MWAYADPVTREGVILVVAPPPNDEDARRRGELADFLKTRRAALQPDDVGLPAGGRRRTPGLRREEVALLAGVGNTWYTWLEQGRDVRASVEVLEAIARALRLTDLEREHLLTLGRGNVAPASAPPEQVSPVLRRIIDGLDPSPACIIGRRHDYLCWNRAFTLMMGDPMDWPEGERNSLWLLFTDPRRRAMAGEDFETNARRMLARFRSDHAGHLGDPAFEELIEALRKVSPEFRKWWMAHEVHGSGEGKKVLAHPSGQKLTFEHAIFRHGVNPEHRLILYTPDAPSRAWLEAELAAENDEGPPSRTVPRRTASAVAARD